MSMIPAGYSDKYGQVYVERTGHTGFGGPPDEPIALFRAQDNLAYRALTSYWRMCSSDPGVPVEQVADVERQIEAFNNWRGNNPGKCRKPGTAPLR